MESRAYQFSKLLVPMIGLCIVSQAILVSFSVVGGTTVDNASNNYYLELDRKEEALEAELKKPPGANADKLRRLALVSWQNNKIEVAEAYLREVWSEHNSDNTTTYDEQFVQDGLNLANLYVDRGSYEMADIIYKRVLEYDSSHLDPNDGRIARDWNNIGISFLQNGETLPDLKARKSWFDQAVVEFAKAEKIFSSNPKYEQQLIATMQNLVVAYSELGEDDKALNLSNLVNKHLDQWNREMIKPVAPPAKSTQPILNRTSTINIRV